MTTPETRPRVVLVSRSIVRRSGKILLLKRVSSDSHEPGKWECPGGKLEPGQDVSHAQEDEVMQETGLFVTSSSRLVYFDSYIIASGKYMGLPYVVIFGISNTISGNEVKLSDEHEDFTWVTRAEALDMDLSSEIRKALIALEKQLK